MLYHSYREKLAKRGRIFSCVWRFRALILLAVLLLLAAAGAMLGVTGLVYGESVPVTVRYGEPFSATAEAVFGSAEFEFRAEGGGEWTRTEPVCAGAYECRAVGKSVVGTARPGEIFTYTILPAETEVVVEDDALMFGETPRFSAALQYGDRLRVDDYFMERGDGTVRISANPQAIFAVNEAGEDVTASYSFVPVEKDVIDVIRAVTLATPTYSFVYDGTPHRGDMPEIVSECGLAAGHRLEAAALARTEVGTYANEIDYVRIFDGEEDVTARYRISYEIGTVTVRKRHLTVETPSASFVYDGAEHAFERAEIIDGSLVNGQTLRLSATLAVKDAGEYPNAPKLSVYEGETDVTNNYELEPRYGRVEILRREIAVKTEGQSVPYDGQPHAFSLPVLSEETPLAAGEALVCSALPDKTDAGNYPNAPEISVSAGETDVTRNYLVKTEFGALVIEKLPLTVKTESKTLPYDGKPHTFETFEAEGSLAAGQEVRLASPLTAEDVGTYPNTPKLAVYAGEEDVTRNYEFQQIFGEIVITPLTISVSTQSETFVYDGTVHAYHDITLGGLLAEGQTLERTDTLSARTAGKFANSAAYRITANGREISKKNYQIEERFGEINVTKRNLSFLPESAALVYDGAEHTFEAVEFTGETSLAEGDGYAVTGYLTARNAGTYQNTPELVITHGGENVTFCYEITRGDASVEIAKRTLRVVTGSASLEYNGKPQGTSAFEALTGGNEGLAAGQRLEILTKTERTNCGEEPNKMTFRVLAGSADVSENYNMGSDLDTYGTLNITPRTVRLATKSGEWVYDGQPHMLGEAEPTGGTTLAEGHRLEIAAAELPSITEAGSRSNRFGFTPTVYDGAGGNVTDNYSIAAEETVYGTLTVTVRGVTLQTGSQTVEYDGAPHSEKSYKTVSGSLVEGHTVRADYIEERNAGDYRNTLVGEWDIVDGAGKSVRANYSVEWQETGILRITKRKITVATGHANAVYDGQPHGAANCAFEAGTLANGQRIYDAYGEWTDAGEYPNVPLSFEIGNEAGEKFTENYEITWHHGTIVIEKRPVAFVTEGGEWVYDGQLHGGMYHLKDGSLDFVEGHKFGETLSFSQWKDVGEYENRPENVAVMSGTSDVSKNYEIAWEYGKIVITPRPVTLETDGGEWVYDGQAHAVRGWRYAAGSLELAEGQRLEIADTAYPAVINVAESGKENLPTLFSIFEGGTAVSLDNYDITWVCGTLTVTKRSITVKTPDCSWVYDGTDHTSESRPSFLYDGDSLGEWILADWTPTVDAGQYVNELEVKALFNKYSDDAVGGNYDIKYEFGNVTIEKRPVEIETGSGIWVYDGNAHTPGGDGYRILSSGENSGLVQGHTLRFAPTSVTNITDSDTEVRFIPNAWSDYGIYEREENRTDNYVVTLKEGQLRVKTPVIVRVFTVSRPYDGTPLTFMENDYLIEKRPPDVAMERIHIRLGGTLTEPGALTLEDVQTSSVCSVSEGEPGEGANRIDFTGDEKPLSVTRRVLRIKTVTIVGSRDGEEPLLGTDTEAEAFWIAYGSLVEGHNFADSVKVTGVLSPDETTAKNTLTEVVILDENGADVTDYYEIEVICGTLSWTAE